MSSRSLLLAAAHAVQQMFRSARSAARSNPRMIEALESRRMLTLVVNASGGDDYITVQDGGPLLTHVSVGNSPDDQHPAEWDTTDLSIVINCFAGNDSINVKQERTGGSITVRGGPGDDHLFVANGNFGDDISGEIIYEENAAEGSDHLQIFDAEGSTLDHDDLYINNTRIYADEQLAIDATLYYSDNIEFKTFLLSGADDEDYVEAIPLGMDLRTGVGSNTVTYGGPNHVLFGTVFPAMTPSSSTTATAGEPEGNTIRLRRPS